MQATNQLSKPFNILKIIRTFKMCNFIPQLFVDFEIYIENLLLAYPLDMLSPIKLTFSIRSILPNGLFPTDSFQWI